MPQRASIRKSRTALGARLRELRRAKGLTQQQVADAIGVEQKDISRWELWGKIRIETLIQLSVQYDASLDYIVRGVERVQHAETAA